MGHTVLQAPSAAEGLRILGKSRVDLLITDFAMPEMTGADLIHAVEGGWPRLPILLVSGYAEIPEGAAVGIPRLAKPFRPHQLTAAILDMMRETGSSKVLSFPNRA
jgi:CheY-like chemotaxis protein